jgi:putative ABC transport system substrate-binding protein
MTRVERRVFLAATLGLLAVPLAARAQQAGKVPRIGFLGVTSLSTISARIAGFRQGLRELGYVEGSNVVIEYRWAEGKAERLPDLADELVRLKVDVIVTGGPADTRAAKKATAAIPIVMGFDNDPVGSGFVASLGGRAAISRDCRRFPLSSAGNGFSS